MDNKSKDDILNNNPHTDGKVVRDYERLAEKLKRLGIDNKSKYSLSPPLGGNVTVTPFNSHCLIKNIKKP